MMLNLQQQYECDYPRSMDFDIPNFMGKWYKQQQSVDPAYVEMRGGNICEVSNFALTDGRG